MLDDSDDERPAGEASSASRPRPFNLLQAALRRELPRLPRALEVLRPDEMERTEVVRRFPRELRVERDTPP